MMMRSKVPGYRKGLDVYQTFTCPRTDSAWTSASLRMNCNVGGDQPYNHYYCIPNAERTHFVEFCYDKISMKTERGNCWELGGMGYLNQVNCTNFVKGCPDYKYLSERVYKIPACLDLNFSEQCFTEEPGCTVLENSTNTLANNQNNADTSLHPGLVASIVALIACVLATAILLLVVYLAKLCIGKNRKGNTGDNNKEVEKADSPLLTGENSNGNTGNINKQGENGNGNTGDINKQGENGNGNTGDINKQVEGINCESESLLKENERKTKTTLKSQPVDIRERDIIPVIVKGHISHLYLSKTGDIWASNDRGKVGRIDPSGKDKSSIKTCSTYTGHFTLATVDGEKGEHIYWVHNEEKVVKRDDKIEHELHIRKWAPISIFFSAEDKFFYVGVVRNNDAKIIRYDTNWTEKDNIHRYNAKGNESKIIFQYPAYLVKNTNGDLCVSDNNKRVIGVNYTKNKVKVRFNYTGSDQNGFTPYGISTDRWGCILIVDSSINCVHIINQEGDLKRYIRMSEHLTGPRGLCIDKNGKCWVGSYGTISVYKYTSDDTQTTTATTESEK